MFRLESVSKSYDGARVLTRVSIDAPSAKTTVLIGPSGSGKSTVLAHMTGLITPDAGTIFFEDRPVEASQLPSIRRRIGYVIQDGGLFPHLTGLANVTLMPRYLGWTTPRIQKRVDDLCALTHLHTGLLARYPLEMSGGQRQRVSLVRALMLDADVLLLDEPLGALDPMVRAELQTDLKTIFRQLDKTVVLVTHDLNEAAYFADQVVLLRDGRVVQTGTVRDLFDFPAEPFVSQFVNAQRRDADTGTRP